MRLTNTPYRKPRLNICFQVSRLRLLGDQVHSTRIAFVEFVMVCFCRFGFLASIFFSTFICICVSRVLLNMLEEYIFEMTKEMLELATRTLPYTGIAEFAI